MLTIEIDGMKYELATLNDVAEMLGRLRNYMLFEHEQFGGLSRYAEQHFLSALASMEVAQRSCKLGWMEELQKR